MRPTRLPARKRVPLIAGAVCLGMTATACGSPSSGAGSGAGSASSTPHPGGSLAVATEAAWTAIDPLKIHSITSRGIGRAVFDTLLAYDTKGQLQPELAAKWSVSPDGKTYTLTLRQGVTFQDGTPFNADAVKFNLDRDLNPANACACATELSGVQSVTTQGNDTVVITLKQPDTAFPGQALTDSSGLMASPTAVQKYGKDFGQHPVGAGPFAFQSQVSGNSITFTKFDGYWQKGKPYLDSVTFKAITESQARYASVTSNAVQVAENVGYREVKQAKGNASVTVHDLGALGTSFVMMQPPAAPFDNVTARRAVSYATDPAAIDRALYGGAYEQPVQSMFPPSHPYYPGKSVAGYPSYDLAKAQALVNELGGLSFTLTILNSADNLQVAQALQAQWEKAGIHATIQQLEFNSLVARFYKGDFQAALNRWAGDFDPNGNTFRFFYSQSPGRYVHLNDPQLDQLLAHGRQTTDKTAREQIYKKVDERLAQDMPYSFLWAADWWRVTAPTVNGIPNNPDGVVSLTDAYLR